MSRKRRDRQAQNLNLSTNKLSGRVRKQVDKQSKGTKKKTGKGLGIWERRQARAAGGQLQGRSDPMKQWSEDN